MFGYSGQMWEITDQKNSEYEHFSRSQFYYINTIRSNAPMVPFKAFQYSVLNSYQFRNIHRKTPVLKSLFCLPTTIRPTTLLKKTPTQAFPYEYCEIFKNTCFEDHLRMATSDMKQVQCSLLTMPKFNLISWFGNFMVAQKTRWKYLMQ